MSPSGDTLAGCSFPEILVKLLKYMKYKVLIRVARSLISECCSHCLRLVENRFPARGG